MADFGLNMILIDGGITFWGEISFTPKPKWGKTPTLAQNAHTKNYMGVPKQLGVLPHITHINVNLYIINLVHAITIN